MSEKYSSKRISCPDFFKTHKKVVYKTERLRFKPLEDIAIDLALLYPDLKILPSSNVCIHCYERMSKMISSDVESTSENELSLQSVTKGRKRKVLR